MLSALNPGDGRDITLSCRTSIFFRKRPCWRFRFSRRNVYNYDKIRAPTPFGRGPEPRSPRARAPAGRRPPRRPDSWTDARDAAIEKDAARWAWPRPESARRGRRGPGTGRIRAWPSRRPASVLDAADPPARRPRLSPNRTSDDFPLPISLLPAATDDDFAPGDVIPRTRRRRS